MRCRPPNWRDKSAMDMIELVDPQLRGAAVMMRDNYRAFTPMTLDKLPARRESTVSRSLPPLDDVPYVRQEIAGPGGAGVPIYIVNARPDAVRPGIFHIHGGGFTASSALGGMRNLQQLAVVLDCPIVTVDYTLAPEATYKRSIEENYAALLWTHRNARKIGIDPGRIALLGESAGGGHAAMLAIAARDRGEVPIAANSGSRSNTSSIRCSTIASAAPASCPNISAISAGMPMATASPGAASWGWSRAARTCPPWPSRRASRICAGCRPPSSGSGRSTSW